jgi:sortase A
MNDTSTSAPDGAASPTSAAVAAPGPSSTRRRVGTWTGVLLVLVGLGLLGYVGWQYFGTNIIAKREHAALREEIKERWENPSVSDVLGPEAATSPLGSADVLIRIPEFGADFEVPMIEGVRSEDLSRGIGHFPGTGPGQIGNFALAGHRVTHGEPFRDLPSLRPGDEVIVETADATYTYELDTDPNDLVIPFTESWVIEDVPIAPEGQAPPGMPVFDSTQPTEALITLTTCSELFHTDDRMIAFGHLVTTDPKP